MDCLTSLLEHLMSKLLHAETFLLIFSWEFAFFLHSRMYLFSTSSVSVLKISLYFIDSPEHLIQEKTEKIMNAVL